MGPLWYLGCMRHRDDAIARAKQQLDGVRGRSLSDRELHDQSLALARRLLEIAESWKQPEERAREAQLARLMDDDAGQAFTTLLTDRVYRSRNPARVVDAARQLLRALGI